MKIYTKNFGPKEAEEMIKNQIEYRSWHNFIMLRNPINNKLIHRVVHKKGNSYWIWFNRCRCYITGAKKTHVVCEKEDCDVETTTYTIGF